MGTTGPAMELLRVRYCVIHLVAALVVVGWIAGLGTTAQYAERRERHRGSA